MTPLEKISIPLYPNFKLMITNGQDTLHSFATSYLTKGLILYHDDVDLGEEAVGFGYPVVKHGLDTIFPGSVGLSCQRFNSTWSIQAVFHLNKIERLSNPRLGRFRTKLIYDIKNRLAALIRNVPTLRGFLTHLSSGIRGLLNLETIYDEIATKTMIRILYRVHENTGRIKVEVDTSGLPKDITEIIIMNEQGARHFKSYNDSSGVSIEGKQIGCWDELHADEARFMAPCHQIAFKLFQVKGAKLFRGRELVGARLAWAGFGYSYQPSTKLFRYELSIERLK